MVKLYTINCPACLVLEKKLAAHNIDFEKITDLDVLATLGLETFPILEVDGVKMGLAAANAWINEQKN